MEQILNIATAEFLHYGFKSVTVDDIARKCGISKKTLYERFKNKDELVTECVKYYNEAHWIDLEKNTAQSKNAVEELVGVFVHLGNMFKNMNPICLIDLQRYYKDAFQYMENFKQTKLIACIKDNLLRGIGEGLFRDEIDIETVAHFRLESVFMIMHTNILKKSSLGLVHVNKEIFELYMYGIASLKGHKLITNYLSKLKN